MAEEAKKDGGAVNVTTANGKVIGIKRPHVLAQYKLVEAIGDSAENRVYLSMCIPLLWVSEIDGVAVPRVETKLQVEGLISRLDEEGIAAISDAIREHFSKKNEVDTAKK